jgi:hypothetical protein
LSLYNYGIKIVWLSFQVILITIEANVNCEVLKVLGFIISMTVKKHNTQLLKICKPQGQEAKKIPGLGELPWSGSKKNKVSNSYIDNNGGDHE